MRFDGIRVWDGERSIGTAAVEWSADALDGEFLSVEPAGEASGTAGLTLLPGLVDTHVHLMGNAGPRPGDFMSWPLTTRPEEQVFHGLSHARSALLGGVTTLRDLASDEKQLGLRDAIEQGLAVGPRIVASGVVGMTGGHNDLFTPAAYPHRGRTADGPVECRKLVRTWARLGMDGIKITTGGGVLSEGDRSEWRNYTDAELDAIVDEAHALDMPVAAHAHTSAAIDAALRAGVDSIEHGTLLSAQQAAAIAAAGMTVAPTLLINRAIADRSVPVSDTAAAKAGALIADRDPLMAAAAAAGVRFVLGTDANGFHVRFGDQMSEVREMARLFDWSPDDALAAATSLAAAAVRRPRLGRIVEGAAADFLVMRGDPAADLDALRVENIVAVVARGRLVHGELPAS